MTAHSALCRLSAVALWLTPPVQEPIETDSYEVFTLLRLSRTAVECTELEQLPHVVRVEVGARGSSRFRVRVAAGHTLDVVAVERVLDRLIPWSVRRAGSTDTLADLTRLRGKLERHGGLHGDDVAYMLQHDPRLQRRQRVMQLLGQIAEHFSSATGSAPELAGNQTFLTLLPLFEAHIAMHRARGLPLEFAPVRNDAELTASVGVLLETFGPRHLREPVESQATRRDVRLLEGFDDLPLQQIADRLEQATLRHYRLQLHRVVQECDAALARPGRGKRARRQLRALRTTADGLRRVLY